MSDAPRPSTSASGQPRTRADRRLIVLRHGITEHNAAGIWQGHLDTPLSESGQEQARAAAEVLAAYRPSVLVSSDLERAAATARIIAAACVGADGQPLEVEYDDRLREIHAGVWQGMSGDQVRAAYPGEQERVMAGEDVRRGVTGETVAEVAVRARAAVDAALARVAVGEVALVVTHGVSARALVADLTGFDQRSTWIGLAGLGNCHWGELREHHGRWRLYGWNYSAPVDTVVVDAWQSTY